MLTVLFQEIFPSKHARSDPEAFWLRLVKAVTASVQPESGLIVYAGPDFPHSIRLRSSKEGPDHIVQNRPGSDLDGWSGFGQTQKSGLEASRCAGIIGPVCGRFVAGVWPVCGRCVAGLWPVCGRFVAGRNRPATSFPLSDSAAFVLSSLGVARSPPLCWLHDRYTPPTLRGVCKIRHSLSAGCMTAILHPLSGEYAKYATASLLAA